MASPAHRELVFPIERVLQRLPQVDAHLHSTFSDGHNTLEEMLQAAVERRLQAVAITDHVWRSSTWFASYVEEVSRLRERFPKLKIYLGFEAKAVDFQGTLDATDNMIATADFILGSVHRYPDGRGGVLEFSDLPLERALDLECKTALGLLQNPVVSALAHPTGVYTHHYGAFPESALRELLKTARASGKPFEINAKYNKDIKRTLELCREVGVTVSLGSDAHSVNDVGMVLQVVRGAMA